MRVGVVKDNMPFWKHDSTNPKDQSKWNGFFGELLLALQKVTNISMDVVFESNKNWQQLGRIPNIKLIHLKTEKFS